MTPSTASDDSTATDASTESRSILAMTPAPPRAPAAIAAAWGLYLGAAADSTRTSAHHHDPLREVDVALRATDGVMLAASVFEPRAARAVALVAPATGVPRGFYRAFARWLAAAGYAVITLDYRGIGGSRGPGPLRQSASMVDWMQRDLPALLAAAQRRAAQATEPLALLWVGHSLGGHALAQLPQLEQIDAAIGVAAQLPSHQLWPRLHQRWGARFFFEIWVPACVRLFGRLPGWAIGGGEDLPSAAALDWSRWGQMPGYFTGDPQVDVTADRWRGVAHLWWIEDDWVFGPRDAVNALAQTLAAGSGHAEVRPVAARDLGLRRLGHFGPFRRHAGERLWPLMLQEIESAVPRLRGTALTAAPG